MKPVEIKETVLGRRAIRNRFWRLLRVWFCGYIPLAKRMKKYYFLQQWTPFTQKYIDKLIERYGEDNSHSIMEILSGATHVSEITTPTINNFTRK